MSKRNSLLLLLSLSLIVAAAATGCKKKVVEDEPVVPPPAPIEKPAPKPTPPPKKEVTEDFKDAKPEPARTLSAAEITGKLRTVYFAFDKSDLTDDARRTIRDNAQVLKDNSGVNVVVKGHCDERGTIEYNLALGERRAKSIREYMVSLGIPASRIRIVSYGEERPVDPGHNETAWAKNRRGEFEAEK